MWILVEVFAIKNRLKRHNSFSRWSSFYFCFNRNRNDYKDFVWISIKVFVIKISQKGVIKFVQTVELFFIFVSTEIKMTRNNSYGFRSKYLL